MPGAFASNASFGVPNVPRSMPAVRNFIDGNNFIYSYPWDISGVTRDSAGNPLGNCTLVLFRTADNSIAAIGVSDASGNFLLGASPCILHYLVAYLAGAPDVAGTSVDTLVGS